MKLFYNQASPFSRKARVIAAELGLTDAMEFIDTGLISPVQPNGEVIRVNPIGKVPVLVTDDGISISDSRVICEYLNHLAAGEFFPEKSADRYRALTLQALADDALTTCVAVRYELAHRPDGTRWEEWVAKQRARVSRTIDHFADLQDSLENNFCIGTITVGCLLGYVDFRELDDTWRTRNPQLSAWFTEFDQRNAMHSTRP